MTHYLNSKGQRIAISGMATPHLKSALAKLEREQPERMSEIDAMRDEVTRRDLNGPPPVGHNMPPEPVADASEKVADASVSNANASAPLKSIASPFEAVKAHVDDLYDEAKNWLDGASIETDGQADGLGQLLDALRKADKAAEDARKSEAKPFDDGKKAVQARYKPLQEKTERAISTVKAALAAWMLKKERERAAAAEAARKEAEAKLAEAAAGARAAQASEDLEQVEAAEIIVRQANVAQRQATKLETTRVNVAGAERAIGLRAYNVAELSNPLEALDYYIANETDAILELVLKLAQRDVDRGRRSIPGVNVVTHHRVA